MSPVPEHGPDHARAGAGSLQGLKVVDLSRVLGGPYCTQILGDHGAEVIKVEPPGGDETRGWGPPFRDGTASYFTGVNRNKKAVVLDLATAAGRDALVRLLEGADVLVENYKPGTLERWGLGADRLAALYPRLIHCRITGFGEDGPLGGRPGYDAVVQAMAGLMSVNGEAGGEPLRVGLPVVDMTTGLNAVIGILLALRHRESTGRGQLVEATLYDSGLSLLHPHAANQFLGRRPVRTGNQHPNIAPYALYRSATVPLFLAVGNDGQFGKLCRELGVGELASDPRFATNRDRLANREALRELLERAMSGQDGVALADQLMGAGVPCGAVLDVEAALEHPQARHRGMVVEIGSYRGVGAPVRLAASPASYRSAPRPLGADTETVLAEHGCVPPEAVALAGSAPRRSNI